MISHNFRHDKLWHFLKPKLNNFAILFYKSISFSLYFQLIMVWAQEIKSSNSNISGWGICIMLILICWNLSTLCISWPHVLLPYSIFIMLIAIVVRWTLFGFLNAYCGEDQGDIMYWDSAHSKYNIYNIYIYIYNTYVCMIYMYIANHFILLRLNSSALWWWGRMEDWALCVIVAGLLVSRGC